MWKPEPRATADRRGLRYESDLTDAEWTLVAPLIRPAKRGGRPRTVNVREVLNAIFYVLWTGCQWKVLPKDLPPRSTVWEYLDLWDWDGTLDQPLSSAGTRLRASRSQGGRVRPSRNDPSHAPAPRLNVLIRNRNFPEGLLNDTDPACGRGWVILGTAGRLVGHIFIHNSDDSGFVAERE